jgi:hypothetical protein
MIRIVLGFAIVIATSSGVAAQKNKASAIDDLSHLVIGQPQSEYSATFRKQFIQAFASYCQQVSDALPANTPAEDAWVASEEKNQRRLRVCCNQRSIAGVF